MDVFELFAKINLDTTAYENGLKNAQSQFNGFGDSLKSGLGTLMKVGGAAFLGATTAVVGFGAESVKAGMSFDASMSQVAATMGKTVDEMTQEIGHASTSFGEFDGNLREFAQFMGQNTAFSATQAADALNYMALAGYSTQQSMDMLPNVLSLAAAGAMDLATASDMVTDTQTAFGISAERTTQMVDEMAKAASTGNTSVQQLGSAFLVVGGLAQDLNGGMVTLDDGTEQAVDGVQELEIALTAMANAGIKGSEAGTHMRNMLLKLSSPTDEGAKAFERLGVSVFDSEGNMRSLQDIFSELNTGLSQLTQEEKLNAISNIFNTRDVASAEALLSAVGEDWDKIGASILDAEGAAAAMAETQLDNLAGDITLFQSALEGAQIAVSDQLTPAFRDFVQLGTQGISDLTTAFQEGGLEGAFGAFGDWLSILVNKVTEALPEIVNAATALLGAFVKGIIDNQGTIIEAASEIISVLLDGIDSALDNTGEGGGLIAFIDNLIALIDKNLDKLLTVGVKLVTSLLDGMTKSLPKILPKIAEVIVKIAKAITDPNNIKTIVNSAVNIIIALVQGLMEALPILVEALPEIIQNVVTAITDSLPLLVNGIVNLLEMLLTFLPEFIVVITSALPQIIDSVVNGIIDCLPILIDGLVQVTMLLVEHLPEIVMALIEAIPVIITSIVNAFGRLGPALVDSFKVGISNLGTALKEWFAGVKDEVLTKLADFIVSVEDWWHGFMEDVKQWLKDLPYNIGVALVETVTKFVDWCADTITWAKENIPVIIDNIVEFFRELPGKIIEKFFEIVTKIGEWVEETKADIANFIESFIRPIVDAFEALPGKAVQWGKDMIANFIQGIKDSVPNLEESLTNLGDTIKDLIGFSEPKKGPLSNFHTYAPDMMELFAEGIEENEQMLQDQLAKSFDFSDVITAPVMKIDESGNIGSGYRAEDEYMPQMVSLLKQILEKDTSVSLEGDAADIFRAVENENRKQIKATGYNQLALLEV